MTKAEVITKVAETTGITKKDTGAMVDAFLQVITNELASGEKQHSQGSVLSQLLKELLESVVIRRREKL